MVGDCPADKVFVHWTAEPETLIASPDENTKQILEVQLPTLNNASSRTLNITANYVDKISEVAITISTLVPGGAFPSTARAKVVTPTSDTRLDDSEFSVIWHDSYGILVTGSVKYGEEYTPIIILRPNGTTIQYSSKLTATVNGSAASGSEYRIDGSYKVTGKEQTTTPATLTAKPKTSPYRVFTGMEESKLPFAETIIVSTDDGYKPVKVVDGKWTSKDYNQNNEGTYTFTATLDLNSAKIAKGDSHDDWDTVTCTVYVSATKLAEEPTAILPEGTYTTDQEISLSTPDTETNGTIHYQLYKTGEESPYEEANYTDPIKLNLIKDKDTTYVLRAWTKPGVAGKVDSSIVMYTYNLEPKCDVTINCSDTGIAIGGAWSDTVGPTAYSLDGGKLYITAPIEDDEVFDHWENGDDGYSFVKDTNKNNRTIEIDQQEDKIDSLQLKAVYTPILKKIDLDITQPTAGEVLPTSTNEDTTITITNTYPISDYIKPITWTPNAVEEDKAWFNTTYTANLVLKDAVSKDVNFLMSKDLKITLNGKTANARVETDENGKFKSLYVTPPKTGAPNLISIVSPNEVTAENGTAWNDIDLPKTVQIYTQDDSITEATVNWTMPSEFSATTLESQSLVVTGTVALPDGVGNGDNVPLGITVPLYVAPGPQVKTPIITASKGDTTFGCNMVTIRNNTDGAVIHYTLDGTEPTEASPIYTGPITVTSSMKINAIALKDGMRKSENSYIALKTVTYDTGNGTPAKMTQIVGDYDYASEPTEFTHGTDEFDAWFTDQTFTAKWDFNQNTVTDDITLYAKWIDVPPVLEEGTVDRTSSDKATVTFTTNEDGEYYYAIVDHGAPASTISTTAEGIPCKAGEVTITLTSPELTAGSKDIYIVVKDAAGNVSDATFKMTIPAFYFMIKGMNGQWTKGTRGPLLFIANCELAKYVNTQVDGQVVDSKYLTVRSGSTEVTVSDKYLETLAVGQHTLRISFQDGYSETKFTVNPAAEIIPDTGVRDYTQLWIWMGISSMAIAGMMILILLANRRRKES